MRMVNGVDALGLEELVAANSRLKTQLDQAMKEATKLKEELRAAERERRGGNGQAKVGEKAQSRYWTREEHERFLSAVEIYGPRDVRSIAEYVGTRNPTQVRTHAQKYFMKVAKAETDTVKRGKKERIKKSESSSGIELLLSVASNQNTIAPRC